MRKACFASLPPRSQSHPRRRSRRPARSEQHGAEVEARGAQSLHGFRHRAWMRAQWNTQ